MCALGLGFHLCSQASRQMPSRLGRARCVLTHCILLRWVSLLYWPVSLVISDDDTISRASCGERCAAEARLRTRPVMIR